MVIRVQKEKDKIMKKTYIEPQLEVVKIETTQMLAMSLPKEDTNPVNPGSENVLAPELPGFSDDELFQFIMIH